MGESFDHGPAGWIRQSRKCCTKIIHNHMVVNCGPMSSAHCAIRRRIMTDRSLAGRRSPILSTGENSPMHSLSDSWAQFSGLLLENALAFRN